MNTTQRQAREFCFQYFFHLQLPVFEELREQMKVEDSLSFLNESISEYQNSTNVLLNDQSRAFCLEHISSALSHYQEIEVIIQKYLKNWKLHRLSKVDHTNLMPAVNEICFIKKAPVKVILNEAIEISKKFGSLESSAFINGVLDSIVKAEQ